MNNEPLCLLDFKPFCNGWRGVCETSSTSNCWAVDENGAKRCYYFESQRVLWLKSAALLVATPTLAFAYNVSEAASKLFKIISLYHFWDGFNFRACLIKSRDDFVFILKLPFSLLGRILSVFFVVVLGLFSLTVCRDGAKLYASFERWQGGSFVLAPSFQLDPQGHFTEGDPKNSNAR